MFITQPKEFNEACPTSRFDAKDAVRLLRSVEEEEDALLEPFIGEELMQHLRVQYKRWSEQYGGISTDKIDIYGECPETSDAEDWKLMCQTVPLLRSIQSALAYRMFANKIYTISTSLNLGGGANRASAGDYDPADDKHLRELRSEFYHNSIRACDNILRILEKDAKQEQPLWKEMWQESDGYFFHEDLLFPSMRDVRVYLLCDSPTKYLSMMSVIRYCQDTYITPRVEAVVPGLMELLLDPSRKLSATEKQAKKLLCQALAYYIKAKDGDKAERNEALMTADSSFSTAIDYISRTSWAGLQGSDSAEEDASGSSSEEGGSGDGSATKTRCNVFPGHENHVPDEKFRNGNTSGNGCCCQEREKEVEFTTISTLMPMGVNRW